MKKILFTLGVLITACNLAISIAYSAVCEGANGGRACGSFCVITPNDGRCVCAGSCTADEMKWVGGAGKDDEELLQ